MKLNNYKVYCNGEYIGVYKARNKRNAINNAQKQLDLIIAHKEEER